MPGDVHRDLSWTRGTVVVESPSLLSFLLPSLRGCREEGVTPWLLVTLSQRDGTEYAVIIFALIWGTDFLHSLADFLYLANVQIVIE